MPNENCLYGMACPECESEGPFQIDCTATFTVYDDGTDLDYTGPDWDNDSHCSCCNCTFEGRVHNFKNEDTSAS